MQKIGLNRAWTGIGLRKTEKGNSLASDAEGLYYFDCILNFEREKCIEEWREMQRNASNWKKWTKIFSLTNKNEAQISLFETEKERKQEKLDEVLDNLKEKYGYEKITRAGKMGIEKNIKLK